MIFLADTPCRREIRCVGLLSSSHLTRLAPISRFVLLFLCCLIFSFSKTKPLKKRFIISFPRNRRAAPCSFPREMEEEAPAAAIIILSCAYCVGFLWTFSAFPPNVTIGYFCVMSILRSVRHSSRSATSPPYKQSSTLRR